MKLSERSSNMRHMKQSEQNKQTGKKQKKNDLLKRILQNKGLPMSSERKNIISMRQEQNGSKKIENTLGRY